MKKQAYLLFFLVLAAAAARLLFPDAVAFLGGGEVLEEAVTALGRSILG